MVDKLFDFLETERGKGFESGFFAGTFICFVVFALFSYRSPTGGADATLGAISANQQYVAGEIGNAMSNNGAAAAAIGDAGAGIGKVQGRLEYSTGLAKQSADGLGKIRAELEECRKLATENQRIIDEIRNSNTR